MTQRSIILYSIFIRTGLYSDLTTSWQSRSRSAGSHRCRLGDFERNQTGINNPCMSPVIPTEFRCRRSHSTMLQRSTDTADDASNSVSACKQVVKVANTLHQRGETQLRRGRGISGNRPIDQSSKRSRGGAFLLDCSARSIHPGSSAG